MDYFDMLNRYLLRPLMEGDVKGTIQNMDEYCVTRTDLVDVLNAMVLGEGKYRFDKVPSKTKSAFTRAYNSQTHVVSNVFADDASMFRKVTKGKKEKKNAPVKDEEEEEDSEEVFLDYWSCWFNKQREKSLLLSQLWSLRHTIQPARATSYDQH